MYTHYHFIGIGGIGMGTLASLVLAKGLRVSGSDVKESAMTERLKEEGAQIAIGHAADNIGDADYVIYSSAITETNPEMVEARKRQVPVLKRAQLLAQLMENHDAITVAGAHGKTTTTSMISNLLIKAGLNPTTAIGGIVRGDTSYNAELGRGRYFVAEVDESDGTFLFFAPKYSIITNIDFEHVDYYQNWNNILAAYKRFIEQTVAGGRVIAWGEDARLKDLLVKSDKDYLTYGFSPDCDCFAKNIRVQGCASKFDCFFKGKLLGAIQLIVPGRHNVLNAMACVCLGLTLGIDFAVIQESFMTFQGVSRRFQIKGRVDDITIVDDYGHHPTEIAATLQTAKSLNKPRLITVFQPHRYTRTKFLMDEFVKNLSLSENLIITDIYAASEPPIEGVSAEELCKRLSQAGVPNARYLKKEDILSHLLKIVQPGDLILTLGAGDITRIGDELIKALKERKNEPPSPSQKGVATDKAKALGHIGVLLGGVSSEREISLKSGKGIYKALTEAGCHVSPVDIETTEEGKIISLLNDLKIDIAFLALHGEFGEDGKIQDILERAGIPYTGSGPQASRIAINKILTQSLLKEKGLLVPEHKIISQDKGFNIDEIVRQLKGLPVVVKPACEGSSIGITIVHEEKQLKEALDLAFQYGPQVLIERYIEGKELTAGILGHEALPLVEIRPKSPFFDFTAKYQKGLTEYIVPAEISPEETKRIQQMALAAYRAVGCRDFSRIDFILTKEGTPFLLEINTIPGFTATSLLPMAAQKIGIDFTQLCLTIAESAMKRKAQVPVTG